MPERFNSFRARLTLFFGALSLLIGLGLFLYVHQMSAASMAEARGQVLRGLAVDIAHSLAQNLRERERELWLLSQGDAFRHGALDDARMRRRLDQVGKSYRHYAWVGVADTAGIVQAAADGLLVGQDVSQRPWFREGLKGQFIGDIHEAVLLAKKLPALESGEPLRFIDFATPILDEQGGLRGVLATHAHWRWVTEIIDDALHDQGGAEGVEAFIFGADGRLLHPFEQIGELQPPTSLDGHASGTPVVLDWREKDAYLTSIRQVRSATASELGWYVAVRQPVATALEPLQVLKHNLLLLGLFATLIFMLLAYRLAVSFSQPIEQLAQAARRIALGDEQTRFRYSGRVLELNGLADSLESMTTTLLTQRQALSESNQRLEHKVAQRTAELTEANRQLSQLARRDALTGLHNRLAANERLHAAFQQLTCGGSGYAVLMMDIDRFKQVNDVHGHEVGDAVLRQVAEALGLALRPGDFLARFGGEEFLVLLANCSPEEARRLAERLREQVASSTMPVVGQATLSIGVALATCEDANEVAALRRADLALYQAKAAGRNRVEMEIESTEPA